MVPHCKLSWVSGHLTLTGVGTYFFEMNDGLLSMLLLGLDHCCMKCIVKVSIASTLQSGHYSVKLMKCRMDPHAKPLRGSGLLLYEIGG